MKYDKSQIPTSDDYKDAVTSAQPITLDDIRDALVLRYANQDRSIRDLSAVNLVGLIRHGAEKIYESLMYGNEKEVGNRIADVISKAVLLATLFKMDAGELVRERFNDESAACGSEVRL